MTKPFATFEALYGRTGVIEVCPAICDVCKSASLVLAIDSSATPTYDPDEEYDSEYGPGCICRPCIEKAFSEAKPKEGKQ